MLLLGHPVVRKAVAGLAMVLPAGAGAGAGACLLGCEEHYHPHRVVVVERTYVPEAPPSPREEVIVTPGSNDVWIPGHYVWVHNHWEWFSGHLERRPAGAIRWHAGHWVRGERGWHWVEGYWVYRD